MRRERRSWRPRDRLVAVNKEKEYPIILQDVAAAKGDRHELPLEDCALEEFRAVPGWLEHSSVRRVDSAGNATRHKLVFIDVAKGTVRDSVDLAEGKSVCPSGGSACSQGA